MEEIQFDEKEDTPESLLRELINFHDKNPDRDLLVITDDFIQRARKVLNESLG